MSRLVLGGASFGKFSQSSVDLLLHAAIECGIEKIDTAPGYGDSEKRIGQFLNGQSLFSINSKVGMPDPSLFSPSGIKFSVENSLRDLGVEQIETLFIHSLDKRLYYKMPLAQGIWTSLRFDRRVAIFKPLRKLFGKPPLPDSWLDYKHRLINFQSQVATNDYATEFLKFALFSGNSSQYVVLGTNSPHHIREAIRNESQQPDLIQIASYLSVWKDISNPNWQAHT
jgi:aryl-alcohol dehydrogenase-like predicted oxidoreductase